MVFALKPVVRLQGVVYRLTGEKKKDKPKTCSQFIEQADEYNNKGEPSRRRNSLPRRQQDLEFYKAII